MSKGKKRAGRQGNNRRVLSDHKQIGKRLVPPMMQIGNVQTFSFVDSLLPNLIWLSALFLRCDDRTAVDQSIEFLRLSHDILGRKDAPPLAHFQNFLRLNDEELAAIRAASEAAGHRQFLCDQLRHQHQLISGYPLGFLFDTPEDPSDREDDIRLLTGDVDSLLDRYSHHSTKVQATAFVALMATGKAHISSHIELPDFNSIFTNPESEDAKRVASFVRASTNSGIFTVGEGSNDQWAKHFWNEAYALKGCS